MDLEVGEGSLTPISMHSETIYESVHGIIIFFQFRESVYETIYESIYESVYVYTIVTHQNFSVFYESVYETVYVSSPIRTLNRYKSWPVLQTTVVTVVTCHSD